MNDQTPAIERYIDLSIYCLRNQPPPSIDGPRFFEYQGFFRKIWGLEPHSTGNPECSTGK